MAKKWSSITHKSPPERVDRVRERAYAAATALELGELRRHRGFTQAQLADLIGISQSALSQIERAENLELATLRKVIAAMGGRLTLRAEFRDEVVTLG